MDSLCVRWEWESQPAANHPQDENFQSGGERIRTSDTLSDIVALQATALGHYATPPGQLMFSFSNLELGFGIYLEIRSIRNCETRTLKNTH